MVLFLFSRLTLSPHQRNLLKIFTVFSAVTFVAVILTISCSCRPFSRNWATLPYPPPRCAYRTQNFYTATTLNIFTDACILSIALPMLWNLRVPLKRKIALTFLLCSGIFVIAAAVIALLMSLLDANSTLNTNLWATREEIAGILAVNAPIIKPMFTRDFWRRDFPTPRRRKPRRFTPHPVPLVDPRLIMETPRLMTGRLGVLESVSMPSGFSSSTGGSKNGSGSGKSGSSASASGKRADSAVLEEGQGQEMRDVWGVKGEDGNIVPFSPWVARQGPRPLLPEPTHSYSSRGNSFPWSELQAIEEEEKAEKSRGM